MQIATPRNPVSFAAADLNGDKNLDLVVADEGAPFASVPVDGSVLVYFGNGNGTFQSPKTLDAPSFPQAVAIADVNNDGNPDIVVLSEFKGQSFCSRLWVFLGDGKGNFGAGIETPLDEYADGLQVADLNGDDLPDLALTSCCGFANTEVWAGNGDGTFNGPTELPVGDFVELSDFGRRQRRQEARPAGQHRRRNPGVVEHLGRWRPDADTGGNRISDADRDRDLR